MTALAAHDCRWAVEAAERLADLGFLLVDGDRPDLTPGPRLLVALRSAPTLRHFDPELLGYWSFEGTRGRVRHFDRSLPVPIDRRISWGRIQVTDRIPVTNQFLTFGGRLRACAVDRDTTFIRVDSPAPILRWSGHSQGIDPLTDEVGAFFARLRIPIDYEPTAELVVGSAEPAVLYAAMLAESLPRLRGSRALRSVHPDYARFAEHETTRLMRDRPDTWQAGQQLLRELGLGRST